MEVGTRWPLGQVRMALRRWALSVLFGPAADRAPWPALRAPQLPHLRMPAAGRGIFRLAPLAAHALADLLASACGDAAGLPVTPLGQVATPGRSDASGLIRLTDDPAIDRDPVWSPFP